MVRAALWESERNAIETVLSDAQVRSVSPAVREFLPQIHAFLGSKMAGEAPPCPKSILGLGPFLRYYLIRCSDEDFDSAVQAVSLPPSPHPQHILDDLLALFPRFPACSLLHHHLSQLFRKVLKQDAKQRALLCSTGFVAFVAQHCEDVRRPLGLFSRRSPTADRSARSLAASRRPKPGCCASSSRSCSPASSPRKCSAGPRFGPVWCRQCPVR